MRSILLTITVIFHLFSSSFLSTLSKTWKQDNKEQTAMNHTYRILESSQLPVGGYSLALRLVLGQYYINIALYFNLSSGNRTPGSRFYSDLLDTFLLHPPARTQASFKALGCSYNCRQLTCGSFQLTHMSRDDHAVQLIEPWRPKRGQNVITALTTLPQG